MNGKGVKKEELTKEQMEKKLKAMEAELKLAKLEKEMAEAKVRCMEMQKQIDELKEKAAVKANDDEGNHPHPPIATGLLAEDGIGHAQLQTVMPKAEPEDDLEILDVVPAPEKKMVSKVNAGDQQQENPAEPTTSKATTLGKKQSQRQATKMGVVLAHAGGKKATDQLKAKAHGQIKHPGGVHAQQQAKGRKRYTCEKCPMSFDTSTNLKRHILKHTGERPFKCEVCNSRFAQSGTLKVHMRMHTGEKPYKCKSCGKCFTESGTLKKHQLKKNACKPAVTE